ncbi:MAG: tetratricopeptide repeat protein [Planctomycetes bacterium]|nr:tetratricopeptide repeat protein [Planctomycetota bacterium]MBI3835974.1 tetratricopeptide repeat protein [Planctomycetota bacterium]
MRTSSVAKARRERWILATIVVIAFTLRVINITSTRDVPTARYPIGDAASYYEWAQRIAQGDWIGHEGYYQAPLYPYVIAVLFKAAGEGVWKILLMQCAFGAAGVWLLWFAARKWLGAAAGLVAAAMLALYGPAVFYDGIVQKASLGSLLTCAFLAATARAIVDRSRVGWLLAGVALGLLALVRENALVWIVVGLAPFRGAGSRKTHILHTGLFLIGMAMMLLPVAIRNRGVSGEWSITTFQAGPNFYIGNHRGASGRYDPLVPGHESPEYERADATNLAQSAMCRRLTAHEVSSYWMSRAWADIGLDFGGWLRLLGWKMTLTWNHYEVADVESDAVYAESSPILQVTRYWHFGVLCPLAAMGLALKWRQQDKLWPVYLMLTGMSVAVAAFYVLGRYRFPLVPPLMLFAAIGCVGFVRRIGRKQYTSLVPAVIVALAIGIPINWRIQDEHRLDAMAVMNAGMALAAHGDLVEAEAYFVLGLRAFPESSECHLNLAMALALQGNYGEAILHYRAALAAKPDLPGIQFNLGVALENSGRREEALQAFQKAVQKNPDDVEARQAVDRLSK